jgi:hypothetical protein
MTEKGFLVVNESVQIHGDRIDEYVEFINKNNYKSVYINNLRYTHTNIDFLTKCPQIEELSIGSPYITELTALYELENVKHLSLDELNIPLNLKELNSFQKLESLFFEWNKNIQGYDSVPKLKELGIWKYKPKSKNLDELTSLTKLEELTITQGSINSLKGCGLFPNLRKLELNYLRNLEYIDEIEKNASTLKSIAFDTCSKIKNHDYVSCLKELESLIFSKCGNIENLQFLKLLPKLKHFSFVDSTILDGDLTPCIGIEYVGFLDKKHYNRKFKELNPNFAYK